MNSEAVGRVASGGGNGGGSAGENRVELTLGEDGSAIRIERYTYNMATAETELRVQDRTYDAYGRVTVAAQKSPNAADEGYRGRGCGGPGPERSVPADP